MMRPTQRSLSSHPVSLSLALLLGLAACSPATTAPGDTGGSSGVGGAGGSGNSGTGGSGNSGTGGSGNSGTGGSKAGSGGSGNSGTGGSTGSGGSGNTGTGGSGNTGTGGSGNTGTGGSGNTGTGGSGNTGTGGSTGGMPGTVVDPPCSDQVDKVAPSINPPGGLMPAQVPQFVVLGYDDNAYRRRHPVDAGPPAQPQAPRRHRRPGDVLHHRRLRQRLLQPRAADRARTS